MVRPRCLAVLRLMISSNREAARSAGLWLRAAKDLVARRRKETEPIDRCAGWNWRSTNGATTWILNGARHAAAYSRDRTPDGRRLARRAGVCLRLDAALGRAAAVDHRRCRHVVG